jgi:hypothetical protein
VLLFAIGPMHLPKDELVPWYHSGRAISFTAATCRHCGSREPGGPDVFSTKEKRWHGIGARNDRTLMTATVVCGMAGAAYGLLSSRTFADAILGALVINDPYAELNQIDQRGPKEPNGTSAAMPARAYCGRWDGRAKPQIARTHLSRSKHTLRRMNRPSASWKAWQRIIGGWPISKIASRTRNNDNCAGFASLPWGQALCGSRCGSPGIAGAYRPGRDCQRRVVNIDCARLAGLEKRGSMREGWIFVGKFKRGRKECLAIECVVAVPDLKEAKAIASKKLIGADEITETELSRAQIRALYLKEGDVRLI